MGDVAENDRPRYALCCEFEIAAPGGSRPRRAEGEKDGEDRSLTQRSDPYASRFSSIASIAESESSVTSAAFSEASYDVRPSTSHSYQDHSAAGFVGQDDRRGSWSV